MKIKEWLQNGKVVTVGAAILIVSIGIGALGYGMGKDKARQEKSVEEIAEVQPQQADTAGGNDTQMNVQQTASKVQPVKMKGATITLVGEKPKNVSVTMEEAAETGLQAVALQEAQSLEGCSVEMTYISYSGTTEKGYWKGKALIGSETYYEFKVDGESGKLKDCTMYTKDKEGKSWSSKENQVIEENDMAAFKKINIDLVSNTSCEIVRDDHFSLNMNRKNEGYTISYEIKNGVLNIKEKGKAPNNYFSWKGDKLIIGVPENTLLESIVSDGDTLGLNMKEIKAKKVEIKGSNKSLGMNNSQVSELNMLTPNASVSISDCKIDKGSWNMVNASCSIEKSEIKDGSIKVVNGSINFGSQNKGRIKAEAVNGSISIADQKENTECQYDVHAVNGTTNWGGGTGFPFDFDWGSFNFGDFNWNSSDDDDTDDTDYTDYTEWNNWNFDDDETDN